MKKSKIKISEANLIPVRSEDGLVAFASCLINDSIYLGNIAIHTRPDGGYRLIFPAKKINGRLIFYHNPIDKETMRLFEKEVEKAYQKLIENMRNDYEE